MKVQEFITQDEYHDRKNDRLKKLEKNINDSIASLKKLDANRRFVFDAQELIYFLEGLCK